MSGQVSWVTVSPTVLNGAILEVDAKEVRVGVRTPLEAKRLIPYSMTRLYSHLAQDGAISKQVR
jgi:hypothetical protein